MDIISIIFDICNDIVIKIVVQEATNAFCKKFTGIGSLKSFAVSITMVI
jgi:hypothetical protein